jgi:hypothetical protein
MMKKKGSVIISTTEVDDCPLPDTDHAAAFIEGRTELSTFQTSVVIFTLSGITLTTSMCVGVFTIVLPAMANDLQLTPQFLLW